MSNRIIKFRAWHKSFIDETYQMIYPEHTKGWEVQELSDEETIPMQFTGLLDKNGKEIYEGDIVKYHASRGDCGEVFYENASFRVRGFYVGTFDDPSDAFGEGIGCLEVIGNIYENGNYPLLTSK